MMYNDISQALAVEGEVLLPKSFLEFGFDDDVRWKSPVLEMIFKFVKHVKARRGCTVVAEVHK
jgi:hypothetical protein